MNDTLIAAMPYLIWGIVAHCIADWVFQNDWMAQNKNNLTHISAYIHASVHVICMLAIFPLHISLLIGIIHMLIDTRWPVIFWNTVFKQTSLDSTMGILVSIVVDQVFHLLIIALFAILIVA